MKTPSMTHRFYCPEHRRGIAMVAVIVLFAICLTLFGLWTRADVQARQRLAGQQFRLQAVQLAEAGIRRAMARRASDPQYQQETWSVPAEQLSPPHAAVVHIRVAPTEDAAATRYEATAVFPVGAVRQVQISERIEIPHLPPKDET